MPTPSLDQIFKGAGQPSSAAPPTTPAKPALDTIFGKPTAAAPQPTPTPPTFMGTSQGATSLPARAARAVGSILSSRVQNAKDIASGDNGFAGIENLPKKIALEAGNAGGAINDTVATALDHTGLLKIIDGLGAAAQKGGTDLGTALRNFFGPDSPAAVANRQNATAHLLHFANDAVNSPLGQAIRATANDPNVKQGLKAVNDVAQAAGTVVGARDAVSAIPEAAGAAAAKVSEVASPILEARKAANLARDAKAVDNLAGTIVQGKPADIATAKRALSRLDTSGVKSYADLHAAIDQKITNLSSKLDETLLTLKDTKPLSDLNLTSKVGDSSVAHNYVQDAITQLKDHYQATNEVPNLERMNQLETKANSTGLSVKELNDLAKLHGQDLNAFNANGEAASGLSKQAAENTRTGVKSTAREIFNNPVYKATDTEITHLIRTRDLVKNVEDKVNALQQKIVPRGWGEKTGRLIGKVADIASGHTLRGIVEYLVPRGQGFKVMNALDLEKALSKNLSALQSILDTNAPEGDVIKQLQAIINNANH